MYCCEMWIERFENYVLLVLLHCLHISGILAIYYKKNVLMVKKSTCPFGQIKKVCLPGSPLFKDSLARASGLVLMLVLEALGSSSKK